MKRQIGGRTVDLLTGAVDGHGVLRPRELALLRYLLDHRDRVVPGDELLEQVWGYRPGVRTKTLYSTIYRLRERLEEDPANPTVVLAERGEGYYLALEPHAPEPSLPATVDRFVGREALLARAHQAAERSRLVTLVGGPGFGKTRLARQVVQRREGAAWMAVAPETFLWSGLARLLQLEQGAAANVVRTLRAAGPCWLVLDDADRLATSERAAIGELLQRVPELRVLATAREPLALPGELLVEVGPLPLEESELLLRDRLPEAELEAPLLQQLALRLQGVPLALELASALIPTLGLPGLLEALERSLETLELAASPLRPGLSAAIARSWELLSAEEGRALLGLATFQASFSLSDARGVLGEQALAWITKLARRSLLHPAPTEGPARYRMLGPIRETLLASAPASQLAEVELAHARWFQQQLKAFVPSDLQSRVRDLPDLRSAAASFARHGQPDQALKLTLLTAMLLPAEACSPELLGDLTRHSALWPQPDELSRVEICRSRILRLSGKVHDALAAARRAVHASNVPATRAAACFQLLIAADAAADREAISEASAAFESVYADLSPYLALKGRIESARAWLRLDPERARALLGQLDPGSPLLSESERLYVEVLRAASLRAVEPRAAEERLRDIMQRYNDLGSSFNADQTAQALAHHLLCQDRPDDAEIVLLEREHPEHNLPLGGLFLAWLAWLRADTRRCRLELESALELALQSGDPRSEGQACAALAQLERAEGHWDAARQWLARAREPAWEPVIAIEAGESPAIPEGDALPARCARALLGTEPVPALPTVHEIADRIGLDLTRRRLAPR